MRQIVADGCIHVQFICSEHTLFLTLRIFRLFEFLLDCNVDVDSKKQQ